MALNFALPSFVVLITPVAAVLFHVLAVASIAGFLGDRNTRRHRTEIIVLRSTCDIKSFECALLAARVSRLETSLECKEENLRALDALYEKRLSEQKTVRASYEKQVTEFKLLMEQGRTVYESRIGQVETQLREEISKHAITRRECESKLAELNHTARRQRIMVEMQCNKRSQIMQAFSQETVAREREVTAHNAERAVFEKRLAKASVEHDALMDQLQDARNTIKSQSQTIFDLNAEFAATLDVRSLHEQQQRDELLSAHQIELSQLRSECESLESEMQSAKHEDLALAADLQKHEAALEEACQVLEATCIALEAVQQRESALRDELIEEKALRKLDIEMLTVEARQWRDRASSLSEEKVDLERAIASFTALHGDLTAAYKDRPFYFCHKPTKARRVIHRLIPKCALGLPRSLSWHAGSMPGLCLMSDGATSAEGDLSRSDNATQLQALTTLQHELATFEFDGAYISADAQCDTSRTSSSKSSPEFDTISPPSRKLSSPSRVFAGCASDFGLEHKRIAPDVQGSPRIVISSPNNPEPVVLDDLTYEDEEDDDEDTDDFPIWRNLSLAFKQDRTASYDSTVRSGTAARGVSAPDAPLSTSEGEPHSASNSPLELFGRVPTRSQTHLCDPVLAHPLSCSSFSESFKPAAHSTPSKSLPRPRKLFLPPHSTSPVPRPSTNLARPAPCPASALGGPWLRAFNPTPTARLGQALAVTKIQRRRTFVEILLVASKAQGLVQPPVFIPDNGVAAICTTPPSPCAGFSSTEAF